MVMDAILATIVHGHTEGEQLMTLAERLVETNIFCLIYNHHQTLWWRPHPNPVLSGRASFGYSTLASEEKASEM